MYLQSDEYSPVLLILVTQSFGKKQFSHEGVNVPVKKILTEIIKLKKNLRFENWIKNLKIE